MSYKKFSYFAQAGKNDKLYIMNITVPELIKQLQNETDSFKKAKIIKYLYNERMISLKEIATHIKKHPSYISHYMQLLNLPEIVLDGYYSKDISAAHLFILARLKKEPEIIKAYEIILSKNLTTAQTEELIRELKYNVTTNANQLSKKQIQELTNEIDTVFLGVKVKIIQSRIRAKIVLELKGDTKKTTAFIQTVIEKLTRERALERSEDDMQVLE